jgi:hypothetical protein
MRSTDQNHQENLDWLPYEMEHVRSRCYKTIRGRYRLNDFILTYMILHFTYTVVTENVE